MSEPIATVRWIDLSPHGLTLHAVRLPSGRAVLVAAGHTADHGAALAALGFRRTRQGHVVHPEPTLKFGDVRRHFPQATVREMPRDRVVRVVPTVAPPTPSLAPTITPTTEAIPVADAARATADHRVHNATWLGLNRRGQSVHEDGAENRYLVGDPEGDFGPLTDVDYLRLTTDDDLPDLVSGLLWRALQEEKLGAEDLAQLGRALAVPAGQDTPTPHALQEALEAASVAYFRAHHARLDAQDGESVPTAAFHAARRLATHLPPVATRSGDTLALAQFSTPLPLAVAARALLGPVGAGRSVLEPTAGHGALLLGLPADARITAVEIDPDRARRLERLLGGTGSVITGDILRQAAPTAPYDYVLANPPFGGLGRFGTGDRPQRRVAFENVSFPTRRLDHWILLETLKQRHPQGRAVYLIGADHPRQHDLETPAGGSRYLLNLLADHYHVEAVIGLHGHLYGTQGAHYPLRLIVIGERGTGFPTVPETTPVARDWDELWTLVDTLAPRIGPSVLERAAPLTWTTDAATGAMATGETPSMPDTSDAMPSIEDELDAVVVYQERYVARSGVGAASTMIPANMATAVSRALDRVEARQGCDADTFVGRELGMSAAERAAHFAPEQIDALALAFDAHDRGRGFIEADETGIGKGRVLAGVCLRAWRQGRPVIFLTEKPNLFSDFYRDLSQIGVQRDIVPLIVNADIPIKDTERGTVLRAASRAADLRRAMTADTLPPGVNLVLATYSQLGQRGSLKADWLCRIAETHGAQLLVDESHNASGDSNTAANVQRLLEASGRPPIFSSATYAKRPDNLSVYASVLPDLFRQDDLGFLLRQGGAPLQEAFSQMLAEDGVLIRREHDLSHITFRTEPDTARANRHRELANRLASILEKMAWLGGDIEAFISEENRRLNERLDGGDANGQRRGHRAGLQTMNFGSRLYQLNRLFLLALKVDHAIEFGAREIEAGRKPVFVVENTLETLLKEIVTHRFDDDRTMDEDTMDEGTTDEKAVDTRRATVPATRDPLADLTIPAMTFRDALWRVVDRMLEYTERDGYGNTTRRRIDDPALLDLVQGIEKDIAAFPDLSLSPLDEVRLALQARGYRIGELSGRSFQVEWVEREDARALRVRPRLAENRVDTVFRFNTDVHQGLIVTRSGSTGLSAHARDDVPGWSPAPRSMFELQIPQNVAERIQFWGRINRRGQCAAPTVVTPSTELPGEMRLIAMQNTKLRQLSANTTSNQDNAALAKHIPDLLNPLGNQIARRWVTQNPFQAARLSAEIGETHDATPGWYINRITSRILLLPVAEQESVLEELAGLYRARFDELKNQGIHPLRTAEFDWKAREVGRDRFEQTPAGAGETDSPFHAPIDFITVDYEEARRPLRAAAVRDACAHHAAHWQPAPLLDALATIRQARLTQALQPAGRYAGFPAIEDALAAPDDNPVKRTAEQFERLHAFVATVAPGAVVTWRVAVPRADGSGADDDTDDDDWQYREGLVVRILAPGRDALHLAGHYEIAIACPGEERVKPLTLHTLLKGEYALFHDPDNRDHLLAQIEAAEAGTRTHRRHLLVGNLYAALQMAARDDLGRPVIYTTADGARERGILLHADVTWQQLSAKPVLLRTVDHLQRFVEDHRDAPRVVLVSSDTGGRPERFKRGIDFVLLLKDGDVQLIVPGAHGRNGPLLHDPRWQALDIPLEGNRTALEGTIPESALPGALAVLGQLKAWSVASDYRDWYNQLADTAVDAAADGDRPDAEPSAVPTTETPTAATVAAHEPPRRVAALTPGA